jgi:hypothetical protein
MTCTHGRGYSDEQVRVAYMQVHNQCHRCRDQEMKQWMTLVEGARMQHSKMMSIRNMEFIKPVEMIETQDSRPPK